MTPATALAALGEAGVRVRLQADGTVRLDATAPPPPTVLALARAHRDGIAALLREQERWAPGPGKMLSISRPMLPAPEPSAWPGKQPPSWAEPAAVPQHGAWCGCCLGRRWWCEVCAPAGWRCWTCHPPVHLSQEDVRDMLT